MKTIRQFWGLERCAEQNLDNAQENRLFRTVCKAKLTHRPNPSVSSKLGNHCEIGVWESDCIRDCLSRERRWNCLPISAEGRGRLSLGASPTITGGRDSQGLGGDRGDRET